MPPDPAVVLVKAAGVAPEQIVWLVPIAPATAAPLMVIVTDVVLTVPHVPTTFLL